MTFIPQFAQAAIGGGAGLSAGGMKNPDSLFGLCTEAGGNTETNAHTPNRNNGGVGQVWLTQGYCDAVRERIEKPIACNGVDDAAQKIMNSSKVMNEIKEFCPEAEYTAGNPREFTMVFQQIIAALTIEESTWKDNDTSWMGAKGLMQLSKGSVRGYAKCDNGCAEMAKSGKMGGTVQANMNNMTCGTAIAMVWVAKDETLGSGSGKRSRGIARYFQPYREIDKVKRARMKEKVGNYCRTQLKKDTDPNGGGSGTPERRLASGGSATS
jgi:hypothetical protein